MPTNYRLQAQVQNKQAEVQNKSAKQNPQHLRKSKLRPRMTPSASASPPTASLNVIALISGGKDSFYSLLHCIRNGHRVVALANLYPRPNAKRQASKIKNAPDVNVASGEKEAEHGQEEEGEEEEDIDSFMYQTIGHSVIPLYESALDIPLYRAQIIGDAVDTARIYRHDAGDGSSLSGEEEDETESLVPLLRRIKEAHPEANAVSAGAILSTYQRTRIENVAGRLGLVPLAWLWMYPSLPAPREREADPMAVMEVGLLEDMASCGCDARIIKVASGGLDDGFLWENVSGGRVDGHAVRRRIVKAMSRFAVQEDICGAVLGEGGEYETLALDGPGFLWKQRIDIEVREACSAEGGVAFMRLKGAKCMPKPPDRFTPQDVRRPALLDGSFGAALEDLVRSSLPLASDRSDALRALRDSAQLPGWSTCDPYHRQSATTWTISNLVAPEAGPGAGEQMQAIVGKVEQTLKSLESSVTPRSTDDIVFATVLLRSMTDFTLMNDVYVSLFKKPNPPARVTVACGDRLPANVKVMVSFDVDLGPRDRRQALHVQSRSYWAPANIGPYSQALSIPLQNDSRLVYIAGQIPLDPASMEIASREQSWFEDSCLRAVLALQHLWRIGEAMQVNWWLGTVAFLSGGKHLDTRARMAWRLWEMMHALPKDTDEEDEARQLDAWDIKYGRRAEELAPQTAAPGLPRFSAVDFESGTSVPPFLAVHVDSLPRGSDIEWQGLGIQCQKVKLVTDDASKRCITTVAGGTYGYSCMEIGFESSDAALDSSLRSVIETHCKRPGLSQAVLYTAHAVPEGFWPGQVVPCRSVWGREGRRLAAAVILQVETPLHGCTC